MGRTFAERKATLVFGRGSLTLEAERPDGGLVGRSRGISHVRCPIFRAAPYDPDNRTSADQGSRVSCKLAQLG